MMKMLISLADNKTSTNGAPPQHTHPHTHTHTHPDNVSSGNGVSMCVHAAV